MLEYFGELGCDVVDMVLADQDSCDRYAAAPWLNIRRWLDANPNDELADEMRSAGRPRMTLHMGVCRHVVRPGRLRAPRH
ncbi:hypothetical protein GCM10023317_89920 [Actinopolymorpha pittospori]